VRKVLKGESVGVPGANERSDGYTTLYENRAAQEVLARACKREGNLKMPFFPSVDAIGDLTSDEIGVMFGQYNIVRSQIGPIVSIMSTDEMNAWIERLAIGGQADPLAFLTLAARSDLLMFMASQLHSSRTANSSPTAPPDSPT